jgi:hypothetical protein
MKEEFDMGKWYMSLIALVIFSTNSGIANAQTATATVCDIPDSGVILPGEGGRLKGPRLITMLARAVDPHNPQKGFVIFSKRWISVDEFKGPLFLGDDDFLQGRNDYSGETVWSGYGCR